MNQGYSICFNEWALDKDIKNELGLLMIISSLCAEKGYCYASNKYLGELFDLPEQTISRKIKILQEKKYITIEYEKRGCEVIERRLRLTKLLTDDYQKCESTINKNVKENNIIVNNTNNNIKENTKRKFVKPTIEEISSYCKERNNGINPIAFYNFYESKDWYIGKNKMKDYKACIRTWELRIKKENNTPQWINEESSNSHTNKDEEKLMKNLLKEFT